MTTQTIPATSFVPWGAKPFPTLPAARDYTCPNCGRFSFFCRGDFSRHAATIWRESVVGFEPLSDKDIAGTVVIRCQFCGTQFALRLKIGALEPYIAECPSWPK